MHSTHKLDIICFLSTYIHSTYNTKNDAYSKTLIVQYVNHTFQPYFALYTLGIDGALNLMSCPVLSCPRSSLGILLFLLL